METYNEKFEDICTLNPEWFCNQPALVKLSEFFNVCEESSSEDEGEDDDEPDETQVVPMTQVVSNVKRKAQELDEEEETRKRLRRASDPHIQRCSDMNATCVYQPLDMEDWCEHDEKYYYGPDLKKRCFDALELLRHFESLLTTAKYGKPFPVYPNDPFSRENFTLDQLEEFLAFCERVGIDVDQIAPTFKRFLEWTRTVPVRDAIDGKPFATYEQRETIIDNVVRRDQIGGSNLVPFFFKILGLF